MSCRACCSPLTHPDVMGIKIFKNDRIFLIDLMPGKTNHTITALCAGDTRVRIVVRKKISVMPRWGDGLTLRCVLFSKTIFEWICIILISYGDDDGAKYRTLVRPKVTNICFLSHRPRRVIMANNCLSICLVQIFNYSDLWSSWCSMVSHWFTNIDPASPH